MFDLDISKFAFLNSNEHENDSLRRKSSNLPRPRLSKENLKLHSKWFDQDSPIRVEVESASSCNSVGEVDTTLKPDFDYDYASIYSEFSECDSGHQTVSRCGSGGSRNKNLQLKNGFLAPPSKSKSGRFRSVSFNENENDDEAQDEDGYSFVSYSSASGPTSGQPQKTTGGGTGSGDCDGGDSHIDAINIVGNNLEILGPFGLRKCVYLDNGRPVSEIEHFVQKHVLPSYSKRPTNPKLLEMRNEAKQIIHEKCGGCSEDQVLFCHDSSPIQTLARLLMKKPSSSSPVVIIGPFQSSAIIAAWRRVAHEVLIAPVNSNDQVDLKLLEGSLKSLKLKQILKSRLVIGSFTAASNISGTSNNDDIAITALLHKYGAYSVWDYGVAGPHSEIYFNPKTGSEALDKVVKKDAIFFSGSEFLGGPQTPDVLIAKKSMFHNQEYIAELIEGQPNSVLGEIRLGLVLQMHSSIGYQTIGKETDYTRQILEAWSAIEEIIILGSTKTPRLPIISFLIKHPETGYFLHHEFVFALLRDLFGIQSSTGSMSDSPHAQKLLGVDDKLAKKYGQCSSLQPGFITISLLHTTTPAEINFTLEAVTLIATQGWKLLPFYEMDKTNATFKFSGAVESGESQKSSLKSFKMKSLSKEIHIGDIKPISKYRYDKCLTYGKDLIDSIEMITQHNEITHSDDFSTFLRKPSLRWFLTPSEALQCIKHPYTDTRKGHQCPFVPQRFSYNCDSISNSEVPPLPPRTIKKSTSLKSLDMKFNTDVKKVRSVGVPFSRREFQSKLNSSYFDDPN